MYGSAAVTQMCFELFSFRLKTKREKNGLKLPTVHLQSLREYLSETEKKR